MGMVEKGARALLKSQGSRYESWWKEKFGDDKDDDPWPSWDKCKGKNELMVDARAVIDAIDPINLLMAGGMTFPDAVEYLAEKQAAP